MSDDDVRPWRAAAKPPADRIQDRQAERAGSEPLYTAVLQASGLRPPPGGCEAGRAVAATPPSAGQAGAKAGAARFMANGRPLRLLHGGRLADPVTGRDSSDPKGSAARYAKSRPYRLEVLLSPGEHNWDQAARPNVDPAVACSDYQDWSEHSGTLDPASSGPYEPPGAGTASSDGSPDRARSRGGKSVPSAVGTPPMPHDPAADVPGSADGPGSAGIIAESAGPSEKGVLVGQGAPAERDIPSELGAPNRPDTTGLADRKATHYWASLWEYAGARALATAGRHRRFVDRRRRWPKALTLGELRALWAAQALSSAGDLFAQVAIAIGVYDRTRSPFLTALAYALTYLPPVLGGQLSRRLTADFPPRSVMISLDLARAGLVASMALAGLPLAWLCVLLVAVILLGAPFTAARAGLLRQAPPSDQGSSTQSARAISCQTGQLLGFLAGAVAVAVLEPGRVLLIDATTFAASAAIVAGMVRHRPAELGPQAAQSEPGTRLLSAGTSLTAIFRGSPVLRTVLLFGWLAGFYMVPEALAVPYARVLGGGPLTVGLLMGAMPAGAVAGIITFTRVIRPSARTQLLGWLAMLCCMPLAFSSLRPPLWVVLILWMLAGAGTAYQLVVGAAFGLTAQDDRTAHDERTAQDERQPDTLHAAQSGLLTAQAIGFLAAGAIAQLIGPQAAVALAGLLGLTAAVVLGRIWDLQHDRLTARRSALGQPGGLPGQEPAGVTR
jgi:hypothetical protein